MDKYIVFRNLEEDEFLGFRNWAISFYTKELMETGEHKEDSAKEASEMEFDKMLPKGVFTPQNEILVGVNQDGEDVGILWYNLDEKDTAFIAEFAVLPQYRRNGYGSLILESLFNRVKKQKISNVCLHVFKKNRAAQRLYRKMGFKKIKTDKDLYGLYVKKYL